MDPPQETIFSFDLVFWIARERNLLRGAQAKRCCDGKPRGITGILVGISEQDAVSARDLDGARVGSSFGFRGYLGAK